MDDGLSLGHTKTTLNEETVPLGSDRAYMGLVAEWLMMLTSQTKNKITVTLETDQIAQTTFCFPLPPTFSMLQDHQIPDLWLHDHWTQL